MILLECSGTIFPQEALADNLTCSFCLLCNPQVLFGLIHLMGAIHCLCLIFDLLSNKIISSSKTRIRSSLKCLPLHLPWS